MPCKASSVPTAPAAIAKATLPLWVKHTLRAMRRDSLNYSDIHPVVVGGGDQMPDESLQHNTNQRLASEQYSDLARIPVSDRRVVNRHERSEASLYAGVTEVECVQAPETAAFPFRHVSQAVAAEAVWASSHASGLAISSSDLPSASTPSRTSTKPPAIITAAPP